MILKKDNAVYNTENDVLINQLKKDGFEEVKSSKSSSSEIVEGNNVSKDKAGSKKKKSEK
ncbi:hypothetical protein [Listeria valentina]|uniref:hypothetical protein n=1 Tax=Listeria valentina TaxID=2705293 RepID=UPI001430779D|nr:hypothetical protein [Listeria valentina]